MPLLRTPVVVADSLYEVVAEEEDVEPEEYYSSLDPAFLLVWADSLNVTQIEPDRLGDPLADYTEADYRRLSHARVRYFYLHALEVFFAHFFANVQCPWAPVAWLSLYRPSELRELVAGLQQRPWPAERGSGLLRDEGAAITWLFGLHRIQFKDDAEWRTEVEAITKIIRLAAEDFLGSSYEEEYNSLKHGARQQSALGLAGLTIRSEQFEGGHSFHSDDASHLLEKEQIGKRFWRLARSSVGWDPEYDLRVGTLVARLLFNLIGGRMKKSPKGLFAFSGVDFAATLTHRNTLRRSKINRILPPNLTRSNDDAIKKEAGAYLAPYVDLLSHFEKVNGWILEPARGGDEAER